MTIKDKDLTIIDLVNNTPTDKVILISALKDLLESNNIYVTKEMKEIARDKMLAVLMSI